LGGEKQLHIRHIIKCHWFISSHSALARNVLDCKILRNSINGTGGTLNVDEIGTILPSWFRKQIHRADSHLLDILLPLWPRIAGNTMAQHSQPSLFASGVLTVTTDCATWGTQLRHMTEDIRAQINGFLGCPVIKKLRIRTAATPSLFSPPLPKRETAPPAPAIREQAMDTAAIADPEIAAALAASYAKYFERQRR
jgi:hypothetical protein